MEQVLLCCKTNVYKTISIKCMAFEMQHVRLEMVELDFKPFHLISPDRQHIDACLSDKISGIEKFVVFLPMTICIKEGTEEKKNAQQTQCFPHFRNEKAGS